MDLMAEGLAVIAFDLVSTSGIGNPDISVMIDLDAVWPCDIARTKATNHISVLIKQHDHVCIRALYARIDIAATALSNPNTLPIWVNVDRAGRSPFPSRSHFKVARLGCVRIR